jgi:hypothetical protein
MRSPRRKPRFLRFPFRSRNSALLTKRKRRSFHLLAQPAASGQSRLKKALEVFDNNLDLVRIKYGDYITWIYDPRQEECRLYADLDPGNPLERRIIEDHALEYHEDQIGEVWVVCLNKLPGGPEFTECGLLKSNSYMQYKNFFSLPDEPENFSAAPKRISKSSSPRASVRKKKPAPGK